MFYLGASPSCPVCQGAASARDNCSNSAWLSLPAFSWSACNSDRSLPIWGEEPKGRGKVCACRFCKGICWVARYWHRHGVMTLERWFSVSFSWLLACTHSRTLRVRNPSLRIEICIEEPRRKVTELPGLSQVLLAQDVVVALRGSFLLPRY